MKVLQSLLITRAVPSGAFRIASTAASSKTGAVQPAFFSFHISCLTLPVEKEKPIGIWRQRHKRYFKEYRKASYTAPLTSDKLNNYLTNIENQAQERFERSIEDMKLSQGISEQLKAENTLE